MVSEAREFGIKLILTLTDSRGDYGGMSEYVRSALGEKGTIKDFYTSKVVRVRNSGNSGVFSYSLKAGVWNRPIMPSKVIEHLEVP